MDSLNLVDLSLGIGFMGRIVYRVDPKFTRLKGRQFPSLERLALEAFPLTVENVEYQLRNMDWS